MNPPADDGVVTLLLILFGALAIGVADVVVRRLMGLIKQMRYLNMEIKRSEGWERRRWERRKRELLLNLIPFYALFRKEKE